MTGSDVYRIIRTSIPARLDRLPWSRFHWRIVIGLGTVWILDGLEVTIVGAIAPRLTEAGSGIDLTSADIGTAAAFYVAGACLGALFFGQLTDRYGRKKLFMVTLLLYLIATVATAFAFAPWYFFLCRFFTGVGIGGEYSAINSAIDELIPARNRGQVDLAINGSFWVCSAIGGLASLLLLDASIFQTDLGWRLAFGAGALLGLGILVVRRHVPESPRWLFIHGRDQEAERIVRQIEAEVARETGRELPQPDGQITVRQRASIPYRELAAVAFKRYPRRAILGLCLFIGQAFLYNAVTFDLGTMLSTFFDVASGTVPYFMVVFAVSNFLGPLTLGRLFDTVGRIPMISGTGLGCTDRRARGHADQRRPDALLVHGARARHLLLRLRGCERRVPHRQRGLPDGNPRAGDRPLLCGRHRRGRHRRAAVVRTAHPHRRPLQGGDRVLHRRRRDGARRRRGDLLRRACRAAVAREHREAADRGGGRGGAARAGRAFHRRRRSHPQPP
jgi:MFS family permease